MTQILKKEKRFQTRASFLDIIALGIEKPGMRQSRLFLTSFYITVSNSPYRFQVIIVDSKV